MIKKVMAAETIDPSREMHFGFHQRVDPAIYPQVHDFYEFMLVTSGSMEIEINGKIRKTETGALVLIRPGDVHTKRADTQCSHINLAFPKAVLSEMFRYLDVPDIQKQITEGEEVPAVLLKKGELLLLKAELEKLNLLPIDVPRVICMELRRRILDIMIQFIIPSFLEPTERKCPHWLNQLLEEMDDPEMFSCNLEELARHSGCTKEHLCRSFRKYLGVSPNAYLNAKRLNYAANLLLHSDQKIIDIAFTAGFQSMSRFYHAFKEEFKVPPSEYRKQKGRVDRCSL